MLNPTCAKQFKKDYKLAKSRGKNMKRLIDVMDKLMKKEPLEQKQRDHNLTGNYLENERMNKKKEEEIPVIMGSDNIFKDLGFPEPEEALAIDLLVIPNMECA